MPVAKGRIQAWELPHAIRRTKAFSLIELLVVVAVVTVLLSILLPALGRSKELARRTVCLNNLRETHRAFYYYAQDWADQAPVGYRSASKQFNSMIFSTTAGGRWVLFGLLYQRGLLPARKSLYCPSETNTKFQWNTSDNPWPADVIPVKNIQAGYGCRPEREIPDDLSNPPAALQPFSLPRLGDLKNRAILADLTAARNRVLNRHQKGIDVLFGDGSAHWVALDAFDQPENLWPEPAMPPVSTYNTTLDTIWLALDRVH